MSNTKSNQTILETLANINEVFTKDSNSILAADINDRNTANPYAVYLELVAKVLELAK